MQMLQILIFMVRMLRILNWMTMLKIVIRIRRKTKRTILITKRRIIMTKRVVIMTVRGGVAMIMTNRMMTLTSPPLVIGPDTNSSQDEIL